MVSSWHLIHLPVRFYGEDRAWSVVDEVLISVYTWEVEGFILQSRPFRALYLPADAPHRVTPTGVEIPHKDILVRHTSRWRKERLNTAPQIKDRVVLGPNEAVVGRVKDVLIDEQSLRIEGLVVSRGVVGDLLSGALVLPVSNLAVPPQGSIKILSLGHPE